MSDQQTTSDLPSRGLDWKYWLKKFGPVLALLLVYTLFAMLAPESFRSLAAVEMMARQTVVVGIAAIGMTMIIISGGIDLSVGSILALTTVVIAALIQYRGWAPLPAACLGIVAGALCGLLNGILITRLKVVPFIVTLGTMWVLRGIAKWIGDEQKIDVDHPSWLPDLVATLAPGQRWMIFPPGVWLMLFLAILVAGVLRFTRLGRYIFAIGSSEETARLCGVPVEQTKIMVYTIAGAFVGLAGLMLFSVLTIGDPTVAVGSELNVIAAVVIGGGSLSGGEGSILGTMVGALIMTVIDTGCSQQGYPNYVQEIIAGAIIIVAVALDRLRHRRTS